MKNVLISGASGFVGQNLISHLHRDDFQFTILNRPESEQRNTSLHSILWSELDQLVQRDIDIYIHLAGKAHDLNKTANDAEYFAVNTELTKVLFDVFLKSNANDFIYFSSVKAVADTLEGPLTEQIDPKPATPYGQSKQMAEAYLISKSLPKGKRVFILRPCMIHGPGNKGNLNLLYKVVERGIPYPLAAFDNSRSFLSIANLNFIIDRIISDSEIPGGVYNLADDRSLSTNEVIRILAKTAGLKPKLWKINSSLIRSFAKLGDILKFPLNSERLKKLTESYVVSNEKIRRVLKIKSLPVSSEDGLITTIKSFRSIQ